MTATINASTTAGVVTTADTSGILQLQTNGTAALTVDASQNTTIAGTLTTTGVTTFAAGSAAAPAITTTGDTNTGIFFPAADTIAFAEGGAEAMRIDSSGILGLGVTPSAWGGVYKAIQVGSTAVFGGNTSANRNYSSSNVYWNGSNYKYITTSQATQFEQSDGAYYWLQAASGTAGNNITFTQAMTLDSSGNLLVGTTSVDSAGSKVQLSSSGNRVFTVQNTANVNGDQALWVKLGSNCNNTSSPGFVYDTGGTNRLIIWGNGNVVNTNNSYGAISDIKLKENIVDATPKLDKLNQVRIVNYNMIGEEQKQLGVIAQELEQIFPSMVDESPDRDKEGNDLGTTTKSVKYSVFVPMLIKAIQELKAIVDAQGAEIAALKGATA
jgi:hypothetical protein